jgi:RNA polymerase primary sigma factor
MKQVDMREDQGVSLLAMDQYMREVRRFGRLAEGDEACLVQLMMRAQSEPDNQWLAMRAKHARDVLVEAYQGMIIKITQRFVSRCRGLDRLDLIQEGNIALLRAIDVYGSEHIRVPFHVHVMLCVFHAVRAAVCDFDHMVRLTHRANSEVIRLRRVEQELTDRLRRAPSSAELAIELGVSEQRVWEVRSWRQCWEMESLQNFLFDDGDERENWQGFIQHLQGPVEDDEKRSQELRRVLRQAIDTALTRSQREIVRLRYGLADDEGPELSKEEVGAVLGKSANNVDVTEVRARERLRRALVPLLAEVDKQLMS